ncbi:hypothetical protein JCM11491_000836 [Sporobolomyces phaffii]
MFSSFYSTLSGALGNSSAPSSTPSTPPTPADPSSSVSSSFPPPQPVTPAVGTPDDPQDSPDPATIAASSAFYRKLVDRGKHPAERLCKIRREAVKDGPPKEPTPEECCGEACGLECVTTVCWRDLHPEWRSIKARLAAEEEDLRIAREEEEALNGPTVAIEIEGGVGRVETEEDVMDQITKGWKG